MQYFLELCLKSVEAAIETIDAEIIVIDNNSPDDSCDMVKQLFPSVTLIENKENFGFSKGNNIGVNKAKGQYLCILNPDTVVAEDTFTKLIDFADSKSNLGIIGCQLIDGKGKYLPESKRNIPTPKVAFKKILGDDKAYYANQVEVNAIGEVDILVGAFMLIKKEVYDAVGGFDEDYFMYGEDIDLSYKILKQGYSNYYYGKTTVIHFKGESTLKDAKYAKRFYGAMQIFYEKHFKKNSFFSVLVRLGIKLASKKKSINKVEYVKPINSVLISNTIIDKLNTVLVQPVKLISKVSEVANNTLVVLDANYLSYKTIIDYMKSCNIRNRNTYRILPKNSTFILGSDSSVDRGEVLHF